GDPRSGIAHPDEEHLGRRAALDRELDPAALRIGEGVARDLRHCGRDPGAILRVEAEELRDLARPLAGEDYVPLVADHHRQEAWGHVSSRATTTVVSSRPRWKSR